MTKLDINVLSAFNGMGCIWLALDRVGIKVGKRYSIEIDEYANQVSKTQRYKMLGNGWTVDVIAHILNGLNSKRFGSRITANDKCEY